jgi:hypothetical protein
MRSLKHSIVSHAKHLEKVVWYGASLQNLASGCKFLTAEGLRAVLFVSFPQRRAMIALDMGSARKAARPSK